MPRTVHTPARNTRDSWAEVLPCMRYPANAGHRLLVLEYCGTVSRYFVAILSPSNIEIVAERAGITRQTVAALEKGSPSVSIGIVVNVLNAMRLQDDILLLAKDDVLGRTLQDLDVKIHKRAPKRAKDEEE